MPLIDFDFLESCAPESLARVRVGIETGTCFGASTRLMSRRLEQVVTIELSPSLLERTQRKMRSQGYRNVRFVQGDSGRMLEEVLKDLALSSGADDPLLFFLDAHWSGDQTVSWDQPSVAGFRGYGSDTAHRGLLGGRPTSLGRRPTSEEQTPLLEELSVIVDRCHGPALILIDDMQVIPETGPGSRDWGFPGEDWSHLSRDRIRSILAPRLIESHSKKSFGNEQCLYVLRG